MQEGFFPPQIHMYHVKGSCTSFGSSYGRGEDMSNTMTKAEQTSFIELFFLSSASLFIWTVYVFGNPFFFSVWLETSKEASIVKCTSQINIKIWHANRIKTVT